jgi:hypothetical protein
MYQRRKESLEESATKPQKTSSEKTAKKKTPGKMIVAKNKKL